MESETLVDSSDSSSLFPLLPCEEVRLQEESWDAAGPGTVPYTLNPGKTDTYKIASVNQLC